MTVKKVRESKNERKKVEAIFIPYTYVIYIKKKVAIFLFEEKLVFLVIIDNDE